jgi:integrase
MTEIEPQKLVSKDRITKRLTKNGEVRYDCRVRIDGQIHNKTFKLRKDADAWLVQQRADQLSGVALDPKRGRVKLGEYSAGWIAKGGTKGKLAPKTTSYYEDLNRLHVGFTFEGVQNLHDLAIGKIRTDHVREWYSKLSAARPAIAPKAYRLLSTIMSTAVADRFIGSNPCTLKGAGAESAPERPLISLVDAHDLATAIAPQFRCMVLLAEFAQLRLGELLGLQVGDLNQAARVVRVERQAIEVRVSGRIVTEPKTEAGKRTVAINDGLVVELVNHIDVFCTHGPQGWLFANEKGRPWWRFEFTRAWTKAKESVNAQRDEAGETRLPANLHFHDLRHSGLTYVAHTGVTTKELMGRAGHASPSAALRYQHEAEGRGREIADALGAMFDAPRARPSKVISFRPRDGHPMEPPLVPAGQEVTAS